MNKRFFQPSLILAGAALTTNVFAQGNPSGADALMNSVITTPGTVSASGARGIPTMGIQGEIRLDHPVARQLFTEWSSQKGLSYEVNAWVQSYFSARFEAFAHLKTAMAPKIEGLPASFQNAVQAAYLYSLYRLNLSQLFIHHWLLTMENPSFAASPASVALDESLSPAEGLDQWLLNQKIQFSAHEEAVIQKVGYTRHPTWLMVNAFVLQRKGAVSEEVLSKLPVNSPFRPRLSMTVALSYAKKNDLAGAARILKTYFEPWMNSSKDALAQSRYFLGIARLLYQAGSIDGAIQFYLKVPKGSPDYLTAREELSWCWLRQGNLEQLRGNLSTLNSAVLSEQFRPESSLVKAISDLKMCNYSAVEKDFELFLKQNREWAKKIESAIAAPESQTPRIPDDYSRFASEAIDRMKSEIAEVEALSNRSVSAVLPAVGPQKHWTESLQSLKLALEATQKRLAEEYRRQWKHDRTTLQEAIRKMQFVKVELLSQVSQVEALTSKEGIPSEQVQSAKAKIESQGDQSFPFDGVVWPDELFKLRAVANGQCAGKL